ncbi:MAG: hypothetical protein PVSMB5_34530 [Ktedonobacteraceae bacterium]
MSKQITRRPKKQDQRRERREEHLRRDAERKREEKRRRITIIGVIAAVVVVVGLIVTYVVYANNQPQTPQVVNPQYPPVDNVYCDQQEQLAFHIHAHLTMYINGQVVPLPAQIGIAKDQSCLYWLHTHDTSGVIHMEAPAHHSFTLGNFLNEWSTQFPTLNYPPQLDQIGWQAYVDGKPYNGDFHKIPLQAHTLITLVYNSPQAVPDTTYNWNGL